MNFQTFSWNNLKKQNHCYYSKTSIHYNKTAFETDLER